MRYLLFLTLCLLLPNLQDEQGKKPSLPPLPEAEVPAPAGNETGDKTDAEASSKPANKKKAAAEGKDAGTSETQPASRPGIGKVQRSLMGVWRVLPTASLGGNARQSIKGYLVITQAHLSFQLIMEGKGDGGSFQCGVRTYSVLGDKLVTNSLQGIRNGKTAGKILLDPIGRREFRKFVLLAPNVLRLIQAKGQILEFQRVEQL